MLFQGLIFGVPVIMGLVYFLFFLSSTGFKWGPFGDVVGVVRIEGVIAANERASADKIIPVLERAFANPNVKAVVLSIDSPGGAPVESERINNSLDALKTKHKKPVVAVINNMGASAAYMIALHTDKIIAGKYSLVGSIGAIMSPWQLDRAIAKHDVSQKVYASGKLKSFLSPFTPITPEVDAKAKQLVDQMGQVFVSEVRARRGAMLKAGVDVSTGEVWGGLEAKDLGLTDTVDTVDVYVANTWGLKQYDFGPSPDNMGILGASLAGAMVSAIESRLSAGPRLQ